VIGCVARRAICAHSRSLSFDSEGADVRSPDAPIGDMQIPKRRWQPLGDHARLFQRSLWLKLILSRSALRSLFFVLFLAHILILTSFNFVHLVCILIFLVRFARLALRIWVLILIYNWRYGSAKGDIDIIFFLLLMR
jgi:hypothetical protein